MVAFVGEKKEAIFKAVSEMYTDVASHPSRQFHFPTGRPACLFVGYPKAQLDAIPATAVESFAGVGYPFAAGAIQQGDRVLDIGSGSGTDVLIACTLVGPRGKVYGLDMTDAMLAKARSNAAASCASRSLCRSAWRTSSVCPSSTSRLTCSALFGRGPPYCSLRRHTNTSAASCCKPRMNSPRST